MLFTINNSKNIRHGKIDTPHGNIEYPAFLPDATYGTIQNLSFSDVEETKTTEIVTNTLHLKQKLGEEYISKFGGLHKFTGWNRPILTDSGGFQVFSLIHKSKNLANKITDAGCSFVDPRNGDYHFLSPESSQLIQHQLDSDIRVVLDEMLISDDSVKAMRKSVERTTAWAKRSKDMFIELNRISSEDFDKRGQTRPLLTAVIQGARNFDFRKRSAEELIDIDFDIFGFGGVPLKADSTWNYEDKGGFHKELLHFLAEIIPKDRIRYALGVGTPDDIRFAVSVGWDIFDTVLPTRNARHGYLYVNKGVGDKEFDTYDVLHIKNTRYKFDDNPIDESCNCHTCSNTSRAYLRYLLKIKSGTGMRLATIHNLTYYSKMMQELRDSASLTD